MKEHPNFRVILFAVEVVLCCFSFPFFPCSHYYRDVLVVPAAAGACRTKRFSSRWLLQWQSGNRCERGGRKWGGGSGEFVFCKLGIMFCIVRSVLANPRLAIRCCVVIK
jgi:hypothetical protein